MRKAPFAAFADVDDAPELLPAVTQPGGGYANLPRQVVSNRPGANVHDSGSWAATADRTYLQPSEGGEAGISQGISYSTGIRPMQEMRPPLDGRTLIVAPGQAYNPVQGQVGRDNHSNDLVTRVQSQTTTFTPEQDVINRSFMRGR